MFQYAAKTSSLTGLLIRGTFSQGRASGEGWPRRRRASSQRRQHPCRRPLLRRSLLHLRCPPLSHRGRRQEMSTLALARGRRWILRGRMYSRIGRRIGVWLRFYLGILLTKYRRKQQTKKHKTWDGDSFVSLVGGQLKMISENGKLCVHLCVQPRHLF